MKYSEEIVGETNDSDGRRVVLLARIWCEKVVVEHPEMLSCADAVLEAVAAAEHVETDSRYPGRTHYFSKGIGPSSWLLVVVSYEQEPARIITAFPRRKDPPQWDPSA